MPSPQMETWPTQLWLVRRGESALAQAAGTPLSAAQLEGWWQALCEQLFWQRRKRPRRERTRLRALRQPVTKWPRLLESDSRHGPMTTEVLTTRAPKTRKSTASQRK